MLRAISEMAVATSVCSVMERPCAAASSRPFWRAVTMSPSCSMATRVSPTIAGALPPRLADEREALLQVERRRDAVEREPELDHREGDLRLDPHHHRARAAQPRGVRDAAQGAWRDRVEDVERHDVDDHGPRPEAPHLIREAVAQVE